jgi:hypothetical protein
MTAEEDNWDVDQWELDQCRYCKGPIEDPTEAYCSGACELKWTQRHDEQADNSPGSSSLFSAHVTQSIQSTPRSTPASSAGSSPEIGPILPSNSVPNLPLESLPPLNERRRSSIYRSYKYGSSHNPIKKSFPSNYYQSTIGDRSNVQPIFADKSVSLGIRKTSVDDIRLKQTTPITNKQPSPTDKKEPPTPTGTHRGLWSWRRLSTFM